MEIFIDEVILDLRFASNLTQMMQVKFRGHQALWKLIIVEVS